MSKPTPDLSLLLPDDANLKARRKALVAAVSSRDQVPQSPPPRRWRMPRLAMAGAMALVVAVALAVVAGSGNDRASAAFAIEPQKGGGVRIEVYSLGNAAGLERALEDAGIRAQVTWLPPGQFCREPHFTPSIVKLPGGGSLSSSTTGGPGASLTISVGSTRRWREGLSGRYGDLANVNLDPAAFRANQSVVLSGSPKPFAGDPEGGFEAQLAVAEGSVERCDPVSAPAGSIGSIPTPDGSRSGASDRTAEPVPGPGELLYTKTKVVRLEGWEPGRLGSRAKSPSRTFTAMAPESKAAPALVTTLKEEWLAVDGKTRERETLERVRFFSERDQMRWEGAGSPPPSAYNPKAHEVTRDSSGRPVKDYLSRSWRGDHEFDNADKLSRLPTDPEALRLAIESRHDGSPSPASSHRGEVTAERLLEILGEPSTSPALRAATYLALAAIPGIDVEHGFTDAAGRRGDAITWVRDQGFGRRLIFDPRASEVLADAEVIFDSKAAGYPSLPDGTAFRETAYLQSEIVDSNQKGTTDGAE